MLMKNVFIVILFALHSYGLVNVAIAKDVTEIGWDNLIPDSARPDPKLVDLYNNGELNNNDPRFKALMKQVNELRDKAPVNEKLNGNKIKIPGFVVPLEMDDKIVREFLLVPYHGACVHVPPPPSNQTIYVRTNKNSARALSSFETVWVTGTIKVVKSTTDLEESAYTVESGFTIDASKIELYE